MGGSYIIRNVSRWYRSPSALSGDSSVSAYAVSFIFIIIFGGRGLDLIIC